MAELAPLDDCGPTRGHAVNHRRQQVYRTEMNIFRLPPLKFMSAVDLNKKGKTRRIRPTIGKKKAETSTPRKKWRVNQTPDRPLPNFHFICLRAARRPLFGTKRGEMSKWPAIFFICVNSPRPTAKRPKREPTGGKHFRFNDTQRGRKTITTIRAAVVRMSTLAPAVFRSRQFPSVLLPNSLFILVPPPPSFKLQLMNLTVKSFRRHSNR